MLRTLAAALSLSLLAGAAVAQSDPYGLPPGYEPEAPRAADGYPVPKEHTDEDYAPAPDYAPDYASGYAPEYAGPAQGGQAGYAAGYGDAAPQYAPYPPSEQGYVDADGNLRIAGRVDRYERVDGGGYYNSGSSGARCVRGCRSSSYSDSSSAYAENYAAESYGETYVAPFAYQRRAETYYQATGRAEAWGWDRRGRCGGPPRCRENLADLHLDASFFSGGLTGGVEGGAPVYVGGGGGGYATASASASAGARAGAFAGARGGGRGKGRRGGGCGRCH